MQGDEILNNGAHGRLYYSRSHPLLAHEFSKSSHVVDKPVQKPMPIALATCRNIPEPDVDEALLLRALADAGVDARLVAWEDDTDWSAFDAVVLRSTWNYPEFAPAFADWVVRASASTRMVNPASLVCWNLDKGYLRDLAKSGVPIVPTIWLDPAAPHDDRSLADLVHSAGRAVLKPTISAGSWLTVVVTPTSLGEARRLMRDNPSRHWMVQPYMDSVDTTGERSLIWIDGEFTHAIRKRPRFDGDAEFVEGPLEPTPAEVDMGQRVIDRFAPGALYGRLDLMEGEGLPMVSELELIEPSLFLTQHPPALERLVRGIGRLVRDYQ